MNPFEQPDQKEIRLGIQEILSDARNFMDEPLRQAIADYTSARERIGSYGLNTLNDRNLLDEPALAIVERLKSLNIILTFQMTPGGYPESMDDFVNQYNSIRSRSSQATG